ncbi:MAG: hypothetical protein ACR2FZ_07100 [Thermoleophilaceae bacterium]
MRESPHCSWCGREVEVGDGYRLGEQPGERRAVFCRLEHVVPWAMQGPHWEAGSPEEAPDRAEARARCARCEAPLGEVRLLLLRHRGEHRIADGFCSVDHLAAWANAGGRWR